MKCSTTSVVRRATRRMTSRHDLALLGELDGVAHQIDDDLAQAVVVADDQRGARRGWMKQASSSPCWCARMANDFIVSPRLSRRSNGAAVQDQLAGLDLGEVEDVVDHREQGLARVLDRLQVLPLLGRERGSSGPVPSCR